MEKQKKKNTVRTILIILGSIILATIAFFVLLIRSPKNVIVSTNTSGSFIFSGSFRNIYVTAIPSIHWTVSKDAADDDLAASQMLVDDVYGEVCAADPLAYTNPYHAPSDTAFRYRNLVFYHREDSRDRVFEYNMDTKAIRELNVNHNSLIGRDVTMGPDAGVVGMYNLYPELEQIATKKGKVVYEIFYDHVGDRIFLEINNTLYEYLPGKKRIRKVYRVGSTNIRGVYSHSLW